MSKDNNKANIPNKGFRYVAYDAANVEYAEFKTLQEAIDWLREPDLEDGISDEAYNGQNWIAEIKYISEVTDIDHKPNYKETEHGVLVNDKGEKWRHGSYEWVGGHNYREIDWDKCKSQGKESINE